MCRMQPDVCGKSRYALLPVALCDGSITLIAYGCPVQAIVMAFGLDERTVMDWQNRAGKHAPQVHEHLVEQPRDLGHVQADELRVKGQGQVLWLAMALMVGTRCFPAPASLVLQIPTSPAN